MKEWNDFVDTMDFVGFKTVVIDEDTMITKEDMIALSAAHEQDLELKSAKKDLERALHAVDTAIHYLDETGAYESNVLDDAYEDLKAAKAKLEGFLK